MNSSKAGSLHSGHYVVLGQKVLCCKTCPMHCRVFSSIPGFCHQWPLSICQNKNVSRPCQCPLARVGGRGKIILSCTSCSNIPQTLTDILPTGMCQTELPLTPALTWNANPVFTSPTWSQSSCSSHPRSYALGGRAENERFMRQSTSPGHLHVGQEHPSQPISRLRYITYTYTLFSFFYQI